ncbi:response regulator transcription factor [Halalkalibacter hemicellulosilyticus]|uniref:Two-component response regulator n=1 Tax=Halalkalibacter hemicellulosilyticusJCM 9152 TaxID=1236971 RepID=W4QG25_9BACI|nr:response regulator transcription factor [Halalkalibacter hemicellulosilyticus]GAE30877.1 two-component response regulator [Halalkalibacter hemicellulosilyticusJCM 9152]
MWQVVIIDDDQKVLRGMKKVIPWERLNCQWAGEAKNGQDGKDLIRRVKPDIVITDIYMPILNGLEMIQELKEDCLHSKVIILSGYNDFEYARQAMRLNVADYLSKPASLDTITEVLERMINQLQHERTEQKQMEELENKVVVYESLVEKEWVKSVVTGTANVLSVPKSIQHYIAKWKYKNHAVLAITYDEPLQNTSFYHSDWNLFRFACNNIINDLMEETFSDFQYFEVHLFQGILTIHSEQDSELFMDSLHNIAQKIENSIQSFLQVKVNVSIGSILSNWEQLQDSMKAALERTVIPTSVSPLSEKAIVTNALWTNGMEVSQKLSEAIRHADETAARHVILSFFEKLKDQPYHQAAAVRLGIEMWTIMTYSLHDIGMNLSEILPENKDLIYELSVLTNWTELQQFIEKKTKQICIHQSWDENKKHRQLVEQIVEYVNEHLSENITLQDIANELYISRNYLGQIFKNIVGESFKNYITRIRMERAKKMLQEGNYLIYEVSEKVGFGNPAYFTTTFKKFTGLTPTDLIQRRPVNQ